MLHSIPTLLSALCILSSHTLPLETFANSKGIVNGFEFGHSEAAACDSLEYALWFDQGDYKSFTKEDLAFLLDQLDSIKQALGTCDCQTSLNSFGLSIVVYVNS